MAQDFPTDIQVLSCEWYLNSNTQVHKSPLSGAMQTLELPGAFWSAVLSIEDQKPAQARRIMAFLTQLRGQAVSFNLFDHSHPIPAGVATGTPVVNGSDQYGTQLLTSGWTPDVTGILLAGDYIQVGSEFKMVVANANSNAGGLATLQIEPPWRNSPADGATVVTSYPKVLMKLSDDKVGMKTSAPWFGSTVIACIEDLSV